MGARETKLRQNGSNMAAGGAKAGVAHLRNSCKLIAPPPRAGRSWSADGEIEPSVVEEVWPRVRALCMCAPQHALRVLETRMIGVAGLLMRLATRPPCCSERQSLSARAVYVTTREACGGLSRGIHVVSLYFLQLSRLPIL